MYSALASMWVAMGLVNHWKQSTSITFTVTGVNPLYTAKASTKRMRARVSIIDAEWILLSANLNLNTPYVAIERITMPQMIRAAQRNSPTAELLPLSPMIWE